MLVLTGVLPAIRCAGADSAGLAAEVIASDASTWKAPAARHSAEAASTELAASISNARVAAAKASTAHVTTAEASTAHVAAAKAPTTTEAATMAAASHPAAAVASTTAATAVAAAATTTSRKRVGRKAGASNRQGGDEDHDFMQRKFFHGSFLSGCDDSGHRPSQRQHGRSTLRPVSMCRAEACLLDLVAAGSRLRFNRLNRARMPAAARLRHRAAVNAIAG